MKPLRTLSLAYLIAVIPVDAIAETVTITQSECTNLVRHVPAPDVAYRPGVDVNGNPVTPADLNSTGAVTVPTEFTIPITIDLRDRLGLPADPARFKPEANIGVVTYREGKAWFNGQPLSTEATATLAGACRGKLIKTP